MFSIRPYWYNTLMPRKPDRPEPTQDEGGRSYGAWQAPVGTFEELQRLMNELDMYMDKKGQQQRFNQQWQSAYDTDFNTNVYPKPGVMEDRMPRVSPSVDEREFKSRATKIPQPASAPAPSKPAGPQLQGPGMTFTEGMSPEYIRARLKYGDPMIQGMEDAGAMGASGMAAMMGRQPDYSRFQVSPGDRGDMLPRGMDLFSRYLSLFGTPLTGSMQGLGNMLMRSR